MTASSEVIEFHEVASIFPLVEGQEFEDLKADIRENGLAVPILLADGKIADGRNRYKACLELGIEPSFREWDGDGDLTSRVFSLNFFRRHLTTSQRAMIGARIKPRFEESAKKRQIAGQNNDTGKSTATLLREHGWKGPVQAISPELVPSQSRDQAAVVVNVSSRSVEIASKVLAKGTPELIKAVDDGNVRVSAAAEVADLPKPEQAKLVEEGPKAVKDKAREIRIEKAISPPPAPPSPLPGQSSFLPDAPSAKEVSDLEAENRGERWLKFWDNLYLFLVSLPRRGGIIGLTRSWSDKHKNAAIRDLRKLADISARSAAELEGSMK